MRSLAETSRQLGLEQSRQTLIPLMESLLSDTEPTLRQALVEQIPEFCRYFMETEDDGAYIQILHILVPMVAELTTDIMQPVRIS